MITIYEECVCNDIKGEFSFGKRPIGSVTTKEAAQDFLRRETKKAEIYASDGIEVTLVHQPCSYSPDDVEREIESGSVRFTQSSNGIDHRGIRPTDLSGRVLKRMFFDQ